MYKTSSQIAHEVLVKLAVAGDPDYVGAGALGQGMLGAGIGGFGARLGGAGPRGALLGMGLGAGAMSLLGAHSGRQQAERYEDKPAPSFWRHGEPVGSGEVYGGSIGAGAIGGGALLGVAPAMRRALEAQRMGKYFGLGAIPVAATVTGALLGSAYGSAFDN